MTISAVLALRDEAAMVEGALRTLAFCDEIIVVIDDRTTDATEEIARRYTEHVRRVPFTGFGEFKNAGVHMAGGDWIVFCDGDERVTPELAAQFSAELARDTDKWAFRTPTVNFFWGRRMEHGGWQEAHVKIVRRDHALYQGEVHERLDVPNERVGWLPGERWHFSHRSIEDNLRKTIIYGGLDAAERDAGGARRVTALTLIKVLAREFGRRMVRRAGWRDGMPGFIDGIYQPLGLFATAVMLWERQQRGRIDRAYAELDRELSGGGA
jgi:glycosyltransferase involved in cell wall biosynthesis